MWLETLLDRLTSLFPRIIVVRPDEGGFRLTPKPWSGTWMTELKPRQWYFIWPLIMEYEICRTRTQVKDIRIQSIWTKDGFDVAVGAAIRYYVKEPMKAQLEVLDYDETLQNLALGIICDYVRKHTLKELKENLEGLRDQLLAIVRKESAGWGLKIQDIAITDIGRSRNIRLLLSSGSGGR